jgi:hypothetical protein
MERPPVYIPPEGSARVRRGPLPARSWPCQLDRDIRPSFCASSLRIYLFIEVTLYILLNITLTLEYIKYLLPTSIITQRY